MRFTLLVTQPPASPVARKALACAGALLREGHEITRLFFFADGVENARAGSPLARHWQQLAETGGLPVTVCSGSAAARQLDENTCTLPIAGMGDWLMASLDSDRLVTF